MSVCFSYTLRLFCSLKVFVFLVVALTSSVVFISYYCLLPLVLQTYSPGWMMWHICYGNWILVMIAFHYYKAINTPPGNPPKVRHSLICHNPVADVCVQCHSWLDSSSFFLSFFTLRFRWKMRSRLCRSVKSVSFLNQHEVITVASVKRKRDTVSSVPTGL